MDSAYARAPAAPSMLAHHYGERVHLVHDPVLLRRLAAVGSPACELPALAHEIRALYVALLQRVVACAWPKGPLEAPSRMAAQVGAAGTWRGETAVAPARTVVVDIARAGTLPAQSCFEALLALFGGRHARQDHVSMSRVAKGGQAVGDAELHSGKIGGTAEGAWVLLPDPMGATGTSMAKAIALYKGLPPAPPARFFALHLIVTPEYLAHMHRHHPDVDVWALRLDRGLSAPDVLALPPGRRWQEERGLDDHAYIVPGAGGIGELLNNAER
jgi:uracil phosphoribosyltransferase